MDQFTVSTSAEFFDVFDREWESGAIILANDIELENTELHPHGDIILDGNGHTLSGVDGSRLLINIDTGSGGGDINQFDILNITMPNVAINASNSFNKLTIKNSDLSLVIEAQEDWVEACVTSSGNGYDRGGRSNGFVKIVNSTIRVVDAEPADEQLTLVDAVRLHGDAAVEASIIHSDIQYGINCSTPKVSGYTLNILGSDTQISGKLGGLHTISQGVVYVYDGHFDSSDDSGIVVEAESESAHCVDIENGTFDGNISSVHMYNVSELANDRSGVVEMSGGTLMKPVRLEPVFSPNAFQFDGSSFLNSDRLADDNVYDDTTRAMFAEHGYA